MIFFNKKSIMKKIWNNLYFFYKINSEFHKKIFKKKKINGYYIVLQI